MTDQVNPPSRTGANEPTSNTELAYRVTTTLIKLGTTAGEIADNLRARGIKGRTDNCDECALAVCLHCALADLAPSIFSIAVSEASVSIDYSPDGEDQVVTVDLPQACSDFIVNFDSFLYPDLVGHPGGTW